MASRCFPMVRGRRLRVTRLDGCGRPEYGECAYAVTKGFISLASTANIDEGEDITVENANGERCVFVPACPSLNGFSITISFCQVEPELYAMLSGQEVITDPFTGDAIGFDTDTAVSACESGVALELWSTIPGQQCSEQGEGTFGYTLFPFVQGGVFGDVTVENGHVNFQLTNAATRDGSGWGIGPYNVQFDSNGNPAPLSVPVSPTLHRRVFLTEIAPPEPFCGCQSLTAPEMEMSVTNNDPEVEVEFTGTAPTPSSPGFIAVDWGDGSALQIVPVTTADPMTGDFTEAPVPHTYDTPGDYEITATYYTVTRTADVEIAGS